MDKIADNILDIANEWSKNHKSRVAVVILGDMEAEIYSALFNGSGNQIRSILMNSMLRDKIIAQCVKEVAEDYGEVAAKFSQTNA